MQMELYIHHVQTGLKTNYSTLARKEFAELKDSIPINIRRA